MNNIRTSEAIQSKNTFDCEQWTSSVHADMEIGTHTRSCMIAQFYGESKEQSDTWARLFATALKLGYGQSLT